jgi:hypothetical protein
MLSNIGWESPEARGRERGALAGKAPGVVNGLLKGYELRPARYQRLDEEHYN